MHATIPRHLLLYVIWASASYLAMRRPHSTVTWHLYGIWIVYLLGIDRMPTICIYVWVLVPRHVNVALVPTRPHCVVLFRPLLPYVFWVCKSLTLRRPHCLLRFQQWFSCKNGNKIRKASSSRPIWQQIDWPLHRDQAKVRKALFDCFRPALLLFPRPCCRFAVAVQGRLGSVGPGTWTIQTHKDSGSNISRIEEQHIL
jgi:hypothetical protein